MRWNAPLRHLPRFSFAVRAAIAVICVAFCWGCSSQSAPEGDLPTPTSQTSRNANDLDERAQPAPTPKELLSDTVPDLEIPTTTPATSEEVYAEGRSIAQRLAETYPTVSQLTDLRAEFELEFGDSQIARQIWEQRLKQDPDDLNALDGLGKVAQHQGDLAGAVNYYRRGVLAQPADMARRLTLGLALRESAQLLEAKSVLEAVATQQSDNAEAHVELACALLQLDDIDCAQQHLEQALELVPNQRSVHMELARIMTRKGEHERAKYHLSEHRRLQELFASNREQGRRIYDDQRQALKQVANLYSNAARQLLDQNESSTAVPLLHRACQLDVENLDARQLLSWLAARSGDVDRAIQWLEQIADRHSTQFIVVRDLAKLELQAGRVGAAENRLIEFPHQNPNNPQIYMGLSEFYLSVDGNAARALDYARRLVALEPSAPAYALMATAYDACGEADKAIHALDQALALDPANTDYLQYQQQLRHSDFP